MKLSKNISFLLICLVLGITIAWQFQSVKNYSKVSALKNQRQDDLVNQLLREQENNANLSKKLSESKNELDNLKSSYGDEKLKILNDEIEKLSIIAGLTTVTGKGIIVTLNKLSDFADIHDDDILSIINELRATDAQAIAINNERIIATSEIRYAAGTIMINGKQMPPPYAIKAIVDPVNADNALKLMQGPLESVSVFADVKIEKSEKLTIPKVRDEVIKYDLLTPVK